MLVRLAFHSRVLALVGCGTLLLWAGEAGSSLAIHTEYFEDANKVWSLTPGVDARVKFAKNWSVALSAEVDGVTGASRVSPPSVSEIDGVSGASTGRVQSLVDGLSGASTVEFRKSGTVHGRYDHDGSVIDLGYYYSKENDYRSSAPMIELAHDFFGRNTTLGFAASYWLHHCP